MNQSADVDWLARKTGGLIDFRLDDDPAIIPDDLLRERRHAYLAQLSAHTAAEKGARLGLMDVGGGDWRSVRHRVDCWRDYFGQVDEEQ